MTAIFHLVDKRLRQYSKLDFLLAELIAYHCAARKSQNLWSVMILHNLPHRKNGQKNESKGFLSRFLLITLRSLSWYDQCSNVSGSGRSQSDCFSYNWNGLKILFTHFVWRLANVRKTYWIKWGRESNKLLSMNVWSEMSVWISSALTVCI